MLNTLQYYTTLSSLKKPENNEIFTINFKCKGFHNKIGSGL